MPHIKLNCLALDSNPKVILGPSHIPASDPDPKSLLVLNCLILGDSLNEIFPVEIAPTKSVGSLKEVIKEKNSRLFNRVDARELVLWNVSDEVADLDLEKLLNLSGKESLSPLDEVSKVFSDSPVKPGRLHIVVGGAEYVDSGRPRKRPPISKEEEDSYNSTEEASRNALSIYNKAWGKKWPQHEDTVLKSQIGDVVDESLDGYAYPGTNIPDSLTYVCLEQMDEVAEHLKLSYFHQKFVVVREEYRWLCERLEVDGKEHVVITGQPGIGKTTFLLYLLLYCLERRISTAIQFSPRFFFIFDEQGAQAYNPYEYDVARLKKCWALSDSNSLISQPCDAFIIDAQRIIQVTSPKIARWKQWLKEKEGTCIFSELPKVLEIAAILKESKRDISQTLSVVGKWGPSVRTIEALMKKPALVEQFENEAEKAASVICANPALSFSQFGTRESADIEDSRVLFVRPRRQPSQTNTGLNTPMDSSACQLFIPTRFLTNVFEKFWEQLSKQESLNLFNAFSSHSHTKSSAGWLHEKHMHERMCGGGRPLRIFNTLEEMDMQPSSVLLPGTDTGSLQRQATSSESFYWIPSIMNFPGIDGVLVAGQDIFTLQALSVAEKYRSPIDGIRRTWNAVSPNVRENYRWHFVIVADIQDTANNLQNEFSNDLEGFGLGSSKVVVQVWNCVL